MIHPMCLWETLLLSLKCRARVSGHEYGEVARLANVTVDISRCKRDGTYLVTWERNARTEYAPHRGETLTPEEIAVQTEQAFARLACGETAGRK